jgi:hypothetical protein
MKKGLIIILFFSFASNSFCQEHNIAFEAAIGRNFNTFSSSYQLPSDYGIKNGYGLNFSGLYQLKFDKWSLRNKLGLQINQFQYLPGMFLTDNGGNNIGVYEKSIINAYLNFGSILTYDFKSGCYIGAGINIGYLLSSRYKYPGISAEGKRIDANWIKNNQYNKIALHIPLAIGYEWKRNAIFINYYYNLTNRNSQSVSIDERINLLNLGYRLQLSK